MEGGKEPDKLEQEEGKRTWVKKIKWSPKQPQLRLRRQPPEDPTRPPSSRQLLKQQQYGVPPTPSMATSYYQRQNNLAAAAAAVQAVDGQEEANDQTSRAAVMLRDPSGMMGADLPKINEENPKERDVFLSKDPSGIFGKDAPKPVIPPRFDQQLKDVDNDENVENEVGNDDDENDSTTPGFGSFKEDTVPTDSVSFIPSIEARENIIDLETMKDNVWFIYDDWWRRISGFLLLIVLASIIATCGIIYDSPATVIGAMIVAPLMTPILGTMLAIILKDFAQFTVSVSFVILGCLVAVGTGIAFSALVDEDAIRPENNSQVAGRISPKLLDLVAALATGAVAAVAMVRSDIAGSLPGVSIAISLVPPLNVVGVCLTLGLWNESLGALTLFVTNYVCISAVGILIMGLYQVHRMTRRRKYTIAKLGAWLYQKIALIIVLGLFAFVGVILYSSSKRYNQALDRKKCLRNADWPFFAKTYQDAWEVTYVQVNQGSFLDADWEWSASVVFKGEPPFPEVSRVMVMRVADQCNVNDITLQFIPTYQYYDLLLAPLSPYGPTRSPVTTISPTSSPSVVADPVSPQTTPPPTGSPAPPHTTTVFPTTTGSFVSEPLGFVLTELSNRGACRVSDDGQCIFSDQGVFEDPYPAFSQCTFRVTARVELNVVGFRLAAGDSLTIGANEFTGSSGPDGVVVDPEGEIVFFADADPISVAEGFEICIVVI